MTLTFGVSSDADRALIVTLEQWLGRSVDCVIGRREFAMGRYCIALVSNSEEFEAANEFFIQHLRSHAVSSCLYVYKSQQQAVALPTVTAAVDLLRNSVLRDRLGPNRDQLTVSQPLRVPCPVTGEEIEFPDFDLVAFYPQASNEHDHLYDPSNYAPVVCINQASDLFGFSMLMRELVGTLERKGLSDFSDPSVRQALCIKGKRMFQDMASRTINAYGLRTNPARLCPAHISRDTRYYVTQHDEAAFGETEKLEHISEMPVVYLERLIDEWSRYFEHRETPSLRHVMRPAICPMNVRNQDRLDDLAQRHQRVDAAALTQPASTKELELELTT